MKHINLFVWPICKWSLLRVSQPDECYIPSDLTEQSSNVTTCVCRSTQPSVQPSTQPSIQPWWPERTLCIVIMWNRQETEIDLSKCRNKFEKLQKRNAYALSSNKYVDCVSPEPWPYHQLLGLSVSDRLIRAVELPRAICWITFLIIKFCLHEPKIKYKRMCDTHFQSITDNIYDFGRPFLLLIFCQSIYFFTPGFTHPNDRWKGFYIKLWLYH